MKRVSTILAIALVVFVSTSASGQWVSGGGGGGGASGTAGGDLSGTYPNPSVIGVNGNNLQFKVNALGSTTTPACNFNSGYVCTWNQGGANSTLTDSNQPTNQYIQLVATATGNSRQVFLPSNFYILVGGVWNNSQVLNLGSLTGGGAAVTNRATFYCDGTNCYYNYGPDSDVNTLQANNVILGNALPKASGGTAQTTGATSVWTAGSSNIAASTADFFAFHSSNAGTAPATSETQVVEQPTSTAVTFSNLYCFAATAAGASGDVVTLRFGTVGSMAASTNQTCTITSGNHSCTVATGQAVPADDFVDLSCCGGSNTNASGALSCAIQVNG